MIIKVDLKRNINKSSKRPPLRTSASQKRKLEQENSYKKSIEDKFTKTITGLSLNNDMQSKFYSSEADNLNALKQVESYFSEEENRMMSQISPKKNKHNFRPTIPKKNKLTSIAASKEILK